MDDNLLFLEHCSNDQLKNLADILVFDKDGKKRYTEELSNSKSYANNYPGNLKRILPEIVMEYRKFGSNSILNKFGKTPKNYQEILWDVCKELKVPYREGMPVELIEQQMLQTLVFMSIDKMNDEDVREVLDSDISKAELLKSKDLLVVGAPLFIRIITTMVIQFASKTALRGLGLWAAKFAASRWFAALAGPVGLAISGIWTAFDLSGPAFRVTIPFTVTVAYYRMMQHKSEEEVNAILQ